MLISNKIFAEGDFNNQNSKEVGRNSLMIGQQHGPKHLIILIILYGRYEKIINTRHAVNILFSNVLSFKERRLIQSGGHL